MLSLEKARYLYSDRNPLAPPDRRYRLARWYFREGRIPSFHDDQISVCINRFLRCRETSRFSSKTASRLEKYRDLATAFALHHGSEQRWRPMIEAYIIAAATDESIALRFKVPTNAIAWFRSAFYEIEHLRGSGHRILHDAGGLTDDEGRGRFDPHRLWRFIGFHFKASALDDLLLADGGAKASSPEGIAAWLSRRTRSDLALKQFAALSQIDMRDPKQMNALFKVMANPGNKQREQDESQFTKVEQMLEVLSSDIPWSMGEDAERLFAGTPIGEWDNSPVELRDDQLLRLAAGLPVPELDELKDLKIPPPRRKNPVGPMTLEDTLRKPGG